MIDSDELACRFPHGVITPPLDELENALVRGRYAVSAVHYQTLKELYASAPPQRDYLEILWIESQVAQGTNLDLCAEVIRGLCDRYSHLARLWLDATSLELLRRNFQQAAECLAQSERCKKTPREQSRTITFQVQLALVSSEGKLSHLQLARELERSLQVYPLNIESLRLLSEIEITGNLVGSAEKLAERFLDIEPLHLGARLVLISLLRHRGELARAQEHQEIFNYLEPRVDRHEELAT